MKNVIASTGMLFASLLVSATVSADCTHDPFRLGWDAARQACDDIASGYVPYRSYYDASKGSYLSLPTPERSCSPSDVIQCKNAMAQYLRGEEGSLCGSLIERNEPIESGPGKTARQVWRSYVLVTCNE